MATNISVKSDSFVGFSGITALADTVVADRGFCSYDMICEMMDRGIDVILRNHQARRTDFRKGTRLEKRNHLILIERAKGALSCDRVCLFVRRPLFRLNSQCGSC